MFKIFFYDIKGINVNQGLPHTLYDHINNFINIIPLNKILQLFNLKLLLNIPNSYIDCSKLEERLNYKINPFNSKNKSIFYYFIWF